MNARLSLPTLAAPSNLANGLSRDSEEYRQLMDDPLAYEKTMVLLSRAQEGNVAAREELYRRLIPRLERFAHGRIQSSLRSLTDTQEIVQETVVRSLPRLHSFKPHHEGALLQYMKQILVNRIRDMSRRSGRTSPIEDENRIPGRPEISPVERMVGEETLERFEKALQTLNEAQRTAVSLHVEMGYSLDELATALNRNSEAARKVLFRGLRNVAALMKETEE
jgi:RNA polymerase sigma factor (sigma-70 family)